MYVEMILGYCATISAFYDSRFKIDLLSDVFRMQGYNEILVLQQHAPTYKNININRSTQRAVEEGGFAHTQMILHARKVYQTKKRQQYR